VIFRPRLPAATASNGADTVTVRRSRPVPGRRQGPYACQLSRKDGDGFRELRSRVCDRSTGFFLIPVGNITRVGSRIVVAGAGADVRGPNTPGNIITGFAAGIPAGRRFRRHDRRLRPPGTIQQQTVTACRPTLASTTGTVQRRDAYSRIPSHPASGPDRCGLTGETSETPFAHESFMDELAAKMKGRSRGIPVTAIYVTPRLKEVLQGRREKRPNWETRPRSPKPGNRKNR